MNKGKIQAQVDEIQWFHDYEIIPGVWTHGVSNMKTRASYFEIPADLSGKRILDVGCADGYFTFLAESRGAEVVAIDSWPRRGFFLAHELRQSQVEFRHMNIYDLHPETFGLFDIVFCFGVYYHLKHPILALERIANVTRDYAIIESEIMPLSPPPKGVRARLRQMAMRLAPLPGQDNQILSRFYPLNELGGDPTNWWVPDVACFVETVRAAGFPQVEFVTRYHNRRGIVRAYKGPRTAGKMLNEDYFIHIDNPFGETAVSGSVQFTGWALSQLEAGRSIERITFYLDDLDNAESELGTADYPIPRPDLTEPFGEKYLHTGYQFTWDSAGTPPGRHTIYALAEGERGWHYAAMPLVVQ